MKVEEEKFPSSLADTQVIHKNIIAIGSTGVGKSSLLNAIAKQFGYSSNFKVSFQGQGTADMQSETLEFKDKTQAYKITLIDTPGFASRNEAFRLDQKKKFVDFLKTVKCIDGILIVFTQRVEQGFVQAKELMDFLFCQDIRPYCLFVRADCAINSELTESLKESRSNLDKFKGKIIKDLNEIFHKIERMELAIIQTKCILREKYNWEDGEKHEFTQQWKKVKNFILAKNERRLELLQGVKLKLEQYFYEQGTHSFFAWISKVVKSVKLGSTTPKEEAKTLYEKEVDENWQITRQQKLAGIARTIFEDSFNKTMPSTAEIENCVKWDKNKEAKLAFISSNIRKSLIAWGIATGGGLGIGALVEIGATSTAIATGTMLTGATCGLGIGTVVGGVVFGFMRYGWSESKYQKQVIEEVYRKLKPDSLDKYEEAIRKLIIEAFFVE